MFDESKVTRVPKGSPEGGQFTSHDGNDGTHKATPAEERRMAELGLSTARLSKREWAIFYERIGKIKKEGHFVAKTKDGIMLIPIEINESNVLIMASGTYEKPKVKCTFRCKNQEQMYDLISELGEI